MPRKKEYRDAPYYNFTTLSGQSDADDTAPDRPWRFALVMHMYEEWRYVGTERWKHVQTAFPPRTVVAEFSPAELARLLAKGYEELTYAAVVFNENHAVKQDTENRPELQPTPLTINLELE